jgi:hypothetical protein
MEFVQLCDNLELNAVDTGTIDHAGLVGTWINSNPDTTGIARMVVTEADGKLRVRVLGVGPEGLIDWETSELVVYASSPSSATAAGFACRYDFGFAETLLQGMLLKGLMVLAQLHSFKDDSNRVPFFVREYFALEHGRF